MRLGTVAAVRTVTIQDDQSSGVGTLGGAALGGVAASTIGGGRGSILASIGGALLGGIVGNAVENRMGKTQGLEITVQLDNGETRVVAQEADVPVVRWSACTHAKRQWPNPCGAYVNKAFRL